MTKLKITTSLLALGSILMGSEALARKGKEEGIKIIIEDNKGSTMVIRFRIPSNPSLSQPEGEEQVPSSQSLVQRTIEPEPSSPSGTFQREMPVEEEVLFKTNAPKTQEGWEEFIRSEEGFLKVLQKLKEMEAPKVAEKRVKQKGLLRALGNALIEGSYKKSESEVGWEAALDAVKTHFKGQDISTLPPANDWIKGHQLPKRGGQLNEIRLGKYYLAVEKKLKEVLLTEKKNEIERKKSITYWRNYLANSKLSLTSYILIFLIIFSVFILLKQNKTHSWASKPPPLPEISRSSKVNTETSAKQEKDIPQVLPTTQDVPSKPSTPPKKIQEVVPSQDLSFMESQLIQARKGIQLSEKLRNITLIQSVLEGKMSLEPLKTLLKGNSQPWAQTLLKSLASLGEIKSYSELEAELFQSSKPSTQKSKSLWSRFLKKLKKVIHIRKLNEKEDITLQEISKVLHHHDLKTVLSSYEALPKENKELLANWKVWVQDRLNLENMLKENITELARGDD